MDSILIVPDFDQIVASTGDKPSLLPRPGVRADQAARKGSRRPADGIDAHPVCVEDLMGPAVVTELEDTDMAVGGCAGQETATLVRGPRDHVYGRRVQGEVEDLAPCAATDGVGRVLRLLTPNQDLAVVRRGSENRAVFRVRLETPPESDLRVWSGGNILTQAIHHTAPS